MNREEKTNTLKTIIQECEEYQWQRKETLFEIIKDLEQEPCEDAISRQAAINAAIDGADKWDGGFNREREKCIREEIEKLSPVTPQPKMGQWIFDEVLDHHYYCSECKSMGVNYWDYCPYCGSYNGGDTNADSN